MRETNDFHAVITSTQNQRVKQIRGLRMRKERDRTGSFFLEGIRIVTEAVQTGAAVDTLVVAPELLTSAFARDLVEAERRAGVPVLEVSAAVFQSLSLKDGPQGLGAVVRQTWTGLDRVPVESGLPIKLHPSTQSRFRPGQPGAVGGLWVALDAVQDPGNLGTILRTADAVGCDGLIFLGNSTDPYDPGAIRASMGAIFSQRLARTSFDELVTWKRRHGVTLAGAAGGASLHYRKASYTQPLVLLMGSERLGLSAGQQAACDFLVSIPMVGRCDSLNLAVATSVILYEIFEQIHHPTAN